MKPDEKEEKKKKRAENYEKPVKINASFEQVIFGLVALEPDKEKKKPKPLAKE